MKDEWNNQLRNGRSVNYSIEPSSELIWRITAQVRGSAILYQANVQGPIRRRDVEEYFRDDLMKEPAT
jgi:hypothetical protein